MYILLLLLGTTVRSKLLNLYTIEYYLSGAVDLFSFSELIDSIISLNIKK